MPPGKDHNGADPHQRLKLVLKRLLRTYGFRCVSIRDVQAELALKREPCLREKAKRKQRASGGAVPQKSVEPPVDTQKELARASGLSHDTIHKAERRIGELLKATERAKGTKGQLTGKDSSASDATRGTNGRGKIPARLANVAPA